MSLSRNSMSSLLSVSSQHSQFIHSLPPLCSYTLTSGIQGVDISHAELVILPLEAEGWLAMMTTVYSWTTHWVLATLSFQALSHSWGRLWQYLDDGEESRLIDTLLGFGISLLGHLYAASCVWNPASFWLHFLNVLTCLWAKPNRFTMLCLENIPLWIQLAKQNFLQPAERTCQPLYDWDTGPWRPH